MNIFFDLNPSGGKSDPLRGGLATIGLELKPNGSTAPFGTPLLPWVWSSSLMVAMPSLVSFSPTVFVVVVVVVVFLGGQPRGREAPSC